MIQLKTKFEHETKNDDEIFFIDFNQWKMLLIRLTINFKFMNLDDLR